MHFCSIQEEEHISTDLLYKVLCVLKLLTDCGFYDPWNDREDESVRQKRENKNKKMTECFVRLLRYQGRIRLDLQIHFVQVYSYTCIIRFCADIKIRMKSKITILFINNLKTV